MGATLAWVKVVDASRWQLEGASIQAGMDNVVELRSEPPAEAAAFIVHRAWSHYDSAFTESWRIVDPHGRTVREGIDREVVAGAAVPDRGGLTDEIEGQLFEYDDVGYQLVLSVDGREVARADFEVRAPTDAATVQEA